MDVKGARKSLNELLEITHDLVNGNPVPQESGQFLRLLEGTFRRNYIRLQAVQELTKEVTTTHAAVEITRNMIEDVVGIEYVRVKGAEKYSKQFFDYLYVQLHQDLEFYRSLGIDIDNEQFPDTEEHIERAYKKVPSKLKNRNNWSGLQVEKMLEKIKDAGNIFDRDFMLLVRFYLEGSRKTHLNPYDIRVYLDGDAFAHESNQSQKKAIIYSMVAFTRLTTRYIDQIHIENKDMQYKNIAEKVVNILKRYDTN